MHIALLQSLAAREAATDSGTMHHSVLTLVDGLCTAVIAWLEAMSGLPGGLVAKTLDTQALLSKMPGVTLEENGQILVKPALQFALVLQYPIRSGQCAFMRNTWASATPALQIKCCQSKALCPLLGTSAYIRKRAQQQASQGGGAEKGKLMGLKEGNGSSGASLNEDGTAPTPTMSSSQPATMHNQPGISSAAMAALSQAPQQKDSSHKLNFALPCFNDQGIFQPIMPKAIPDFTAVADMTGLESMEDSELESFAHCDERYASELRKRKRSQCND